MTKIEDNLCRICEQHTINFLNASTSKYKSIVAKYLALADVTLEFNDDLPKNFCKKCIKTLNIAYDFKVQCELAYSKFVALLKSHPTQSLVHVDINNHTSADNDAIENDQVFETEDTNEKLDSNTVEVKIEPDVSTIQQSIVTKPEREFECTNCSKTFIHRKNLLRHMRELHKLDIPKRYKTEKTVVEKVRKPKKQFECTNCSTIFAQKKQLLHHMSVQHKIETAKPPEKKRKACDLCDKTFFDLSSLGRHKKRIHFRQAVKIYSKKTPCELCGRIFASVTTKNRHVNVVHKAERLFVCTICGSSFGQMVGLQNHILSMHSEERKFKCDKCPSAFKVKSTLLVHQNTHLPKEERNKYNYTRHNKVRQKRYNRERQKRYNNRRTICEICGQSIVVSGMEGHMRTHDGLKPFECIVCSKCFSTKQMLQRHAYIHSAERRYKCEQCDKSFRQFSVLRQHRIWHTGNKAYKCSYCEKSFFQSANLRLHERIHTGERPYECNVCANRFSSSGLLRKHVSTVHLNVNEQR